MDEYVNHQPQARQKQYFTAFINYDIMSMFRTYLPLTNDQSN